MNSHNHPMFGSVGSWLYKALAGINLAPDAIGFEKIRIEPQMVRDLRHAAGSVQTYRGTRVLSRGRGDDGKSGSMPSSRSAARPRSSCPGSIFRTWS